MDKENKKLPEAPASVTARVVSDQGFHLLFTLRDTTVSGLISKFEEFQKHVLSRGWKPESFGYAQDKSFGKTNGQTGLSSKVYAQEISAPKSKDTKSSPATCSICGAPATKKTGTRKDGTVWEGVFCSTGDESHKVWLS